MSQNKLSKVVEQSHEVTHPETEGKLTVLLREVTREGTTKGVQYLAPELKTLQQCLDFWGEEQVFDIVLTDVNKRSRKWSHEASDPTTGELDEADYNRMLCEYSSRSETVKEIKERMYDLAMNGFQAIDARQDLTPEQKVVEYGKLASKMQKLKAAIVSKKRKTAEDEAEAGETEVPATV